MSWNDDVVSLLTKRVVCMVKWQSAIGFPKLISWAGCSLVEVQLKKVDCKWYRHTHW